MVSGKRAASGQAEAFRAASATLPCIDTPPCPRHPGAAGAACLRPGPDVDVAVGNTASRGVLEANGLRSWGVERLGAPVRGGRADQGCFDVLAEEWLAGQAERIRGSGPRR